MRESTLNLNGHYGTIQIQILSYEHVLSTNNVQEAYLKRLKANKLLLEEPHTYDVFNRRILDVFTVIVYALLLAVIADAAGL
jgi:hypothetical protein